MKRFEIRLECLKIAAARVSTPDLAIETAKKFEEYVAPLSSGSLDKPKGPGAPPSKEAPTTPEEGAG